MKRLIKYILIIGAIFLLLGTIFGQPKDDGKSRMSDQDRKEVVKKNTDQKKTDGASTETRPFLMGFTQWPPSFEAKDILEMYKFNAKYGDIMAYHQTAGIPWDDAYNNRKLTRLEDKDWDFVRDNMPKGKKRYIAITPLDSDRTGLANNVTNDNDNASLPDEWKNLHFNDPKVKQAYLNYALKAVDYFDPDYLVIAIEPNNLLNKKADKWGEFAELYESTYRGVKNMHPNLPVFFTAQFENLMAYTSDSHGKAELHRESVKNLLKNADMLGISSYPYMGDKSDVPDNYFEPLNQFGKPIAIGESGYVSRPFKILGFTINGSEEKQVHYFKVLFNSAKKDNYNFIINWVSYDFDKLVDQMPPVVRDLGRIWMTTGLIENGGREKPSFDLWKHYYELPVKS